MRHPRRVVFGSMLAIPLLIVSGDRATAQELLHTTGQNVQAVFEGWQRNPDGTFTMVFGYLNRNYVEEPNVPIGPNNSFEPGPADRGQPTHFYPRRQSFVFEVTVPADWGEKDLIWTLNHNGKPTTAYGSLWASWEIDDGVWRANRGSGIRGGRTGREYVPDQRPSITVLGDETVTVTLPETVTVTVSASDDDGRPGPRSDRNTQSRRPEREPVVSTTGVPAIERRSGPSSQDMVKARVAYETGLAVSWLHYRGPGKVTFDPMASPVKDDGKATTTVRFSEAGTYVVRAVADDGVLTTPVDVTVIVKGGVPQVRR